MISIWIPYASSSTEAATTDVGLFSWDSPTLSPMRRRLRRSSWAAENAIENQDFGIIILKSIGCHIKNLVQDGHQIFNFWMLYPISSLGRYSSWIHLVVNCRFMSSIWQIIVSKSMLWALFASIVYCFFRRCLNWTQTLIFKSFWDIGNVRMKYIQTQCGGWVWVNFNIILSTKMEHPRKSNKIAGLPGNHKGVPGTPTDFCWCFVDFLIDQQEPIPISHTMFVSLRQEWDFSINFIQSKQSLQEPPGPRGLLLY